MVLYCSLQTWRRTQLQQIKRMLKEQHNQIVAAVQADLGRPQLECVIAELCVVEAEVDLALAKLNDWAKPRPVRCTPSARRYL
jgi:aldehyde dehydrogenase (NAD+)